MASNAELKVAPEANYAIDDRINRTVQSLLKRTKANIKPIKGSKITVLKNVSKMIDFSGKHSRHNQPAKADFKPYYKHELTSRDSYNYYVDDTLPEEIQNNLANLHNFKYSINNEFACSGSVLAVMLVNSAPKKVDERNQIRATWGFVREYSGATLATMFIVGQTPGDDQLQTELERESQEKFGFYSG